MDRTELFEKMPVKRAVLRQIVPAVASQMVAVVYNLTDTYFVGKLNAPEHTAAVTVVAASFILLNAVASLFGVGGASVIARKLGAKKPHEAREVASIAFWLGLGTALLAAALYAVFMRPLLYVSGAKDDFYALAAGYAKWVMVIGGPFAIMNTLLANLVRAEGNAAHASIGVSLGGIMNIALDPFFVLPRFLGLGAVGAGMATAISNMIATGYFAVLLLIKRKDRIMNLQLRALKRIKFHVGAILAVGFPSALQHALTTVAVAAQARFVAGYATQAVAALGIIKKLDFLPLYFTIGVATGLLPLLGYNYAAGNEKRRREAFRFGCSIAVGFALICLVCYELFAPQLASLFIKDALTIEYAAAFLRRMVVAMPLMALCYPMIVQFQAMGKVRESLIVSILRKGVLDIPLLFIMNALLPLYGCMWVQPIIDGVALIVASLLYRRAIKNPPLEQKLQSACP
ncbi:MAG: MATE family efflux transporter [Clostridia bacterium]|nr:MATE family efflux transporter [Clostridia bacterium]